MEATQSPITHTLATTVRTPRCNRGSIEAHVHNLGATPSLERVPPSSEANCDCTCFNGIRFNQPFSLGSSNDRMCDGCQAEKEECLLGEQQLAFDFNQIKTSYMLKE
ncbi:hypothetical protein COCSADRAFT_348326 [Bipolaris sorokiniana ND90Pr]|uniref:Uncharacterized protein n=1 Tax=Cochliobolus sativus (strain ND90Pr / ATCC 201652) TaxID=665912 RepID=M2SQ82_COCSN|nr:uncharacterized protein COCSADRAFT_348326 [Bipolaris sorokiniana ND90Pr]EMD58912.1 hypothetical protein COCSADRAFT_348326 [Bipolaris sorokiniana ND90Pr]